MTRPAGAGLARVRTAVAVGLALGVLGVGACDRPAADSAPDGVGEDSIVAGSGAEGVAPDTALTPPDSATGSAAAVRDSAAAVDSAGAGAGGAPAALPPMTGFDTVFVYFTNPAEEQVPASRPVPGSLHGLRAAFTELLEGPTPAERAAGLQSWFSRETAGMLREVAFEDGFAVVDFEDLRPVIPNAVGSAGALMLMGELTATAFQFPAVERVEFRIDGSCEALMAWLQFGCYPIRRASWDAPAAFRLAVR